MFYNITSADKMIRFALGLILIYMGLAYHPLFALGAVALLASAATNSCLVYKMLGINRDLEATHRYLSVLPRYNPEPVLIFCDRGMLLFRNRAAESLLPELRTLTQLHEALDAGAFIQSAGEEVMRYRFGEKTYQLVLRGNTKENFVMVYGFDISLIVESEAALTRLALFDPLTHLANRKQLLIDLQDAGEVSLTLVDIKNFGQINSFYGHEIGDQFLQAFVQMLRALQNDHAMRLYRLQGDVFALMHKRDALHTIHTFFSGRYVVFDALEFALEVTMGHALHVTQEHSLLGMAETALIEAKKRAMASLCYKDLGNITERYLQNLQWSKRIREILSGQGEGVLVAYFQPIVNAQSGRIEKYETLARVIGEGKVIPPMLFLDPAKQLGLPECSWHYSIAVAHVKVSTLFYMYYLLALLAALLYLFLFPFYTASNF
jgi:diguanylate cyclase (GGDEF)-like protein